MLAEPGTMAPRALSTNVAAVILLLWVVPNAVVGVALVVYAFTNDWGGLAMAAFIAAIGIGWLAFAGWLVYIGVGLLRRVRAMLDLATITMAALTAITAFGWLIALLEEGPLGSLPFLAGLLLNMALLKLLNSDGTRDEFVITRSETLRRSPEEVKAALAAVPAEPAAKKPDPILVADDMVKTFGGL